MVRHLLAVLQQHGLLRLKNASPAVGRWSERISGYQIARAAASAAPVGAVPQRQQHRFAHRPGETRDRGWTWRKSDNGWALFTRDPEQVRFTFLDALPRCAR